MKVKPVTIGGKQPKTENLKQQLYRLTVSSTIFSHFWFYAKPSKIQKNELRQKQFLIKFGQEVRILMPSKRITEFK